MGFILTILPRSSSGRVPLYDIIFPLEVLVSMLPSQPLPVSDGMDATVQDR